MSLSIYSSWFNVEKMKFGWRETLSNWIEFLSPINGQIVIVINKSEDDSPRLIREYAKENIDPRSLLKIEVIDIDIPYTDPEFDGKGKAAALEKCTQPYCILLDCDELVLVGQRALWIGLVNEMERNYSFDALFVPVVDLFGDERHYKSIGFKWYIHRNKSNITRGVFKGGYREDGSINTEASDTCECIYKDSRELVKSQYILIQGMPHFITIAQLESNAVPFVVHTGWLDKEQRLRQSAFWQPVWTNRAQKEIKTESTLQDLEKIPRFKHNLPMWRRLS